jgi:mono/diheme cytochrome c family protein
MIKHALVLGFLILAPAAAVLLASPSADAQQEARIARGKYIVNSFGCTDCHTPFKMGPNGPEKDAAFFLAGHPAQLVMPPAPKLAPSDPWNTTVSATLTAWSGPWGTSFTANLTQDDETGTG